MNKLSEELQSEQYYINLLNEIIEEKDIEMKNYLQKGDNYTSFINEQSERLMNTTIELIRTREISFLEASSIIVEEWKEKTFK